jgi:hypothetical protein
VRFFRAIKTEDVMANIVWFPVDLRESVGAFAGPALVIPVLKAVRGRRGIKTAMRCAEEMIVATPTIIARESGPERAREVLDLAGRALPPRR